MGGKEVDNLIEEMFGFAVADDDGKPEEEESKPLPASPEPEVEVETTAGTPLEAAQALQEAVKGHQGRRKSVDAWKSVAAPVMGRKRLSKKLWQSVLDAGTEAGLFEIDETSLSYPTLVPKDPPPPVEEEPFEDEEDEEDSLTWKRKTTPAVDLEPIPIPENWNPPRHLDCGHMSWGSDEKHAEARAEGHCCLGGKEKRPVSWQYLKGEYIRPLPEGVRRTVAKTEGHGFPGYCCDPETGLYIGGTTNNCFYHNAPDGPFCVVHDPKRRRR